MPLVAAALAAAANTSLSSAHTRQGRRPNRGQAKALEDVLRLPASYFTGLANTKVLLCFAAGSVSRGSVLTLSSNPG